MEKERLRCLLTVEYEKSFSQIKMIKTRLRNRLGETSLSHLMKIAIESPEKLSDSDLENIVDIWYRKSRRIIVQVQVLMYSLLLLNIHVHSYYVINKFTSSKGARETQAGGECSPVPPERSPVNCSAELLHYEVMKVN